MNDLLTASRKFIKKNSSIILTCLGAAGVVATSAMAIKATPKALDIIEIAKEEKGEDLTRMEATKVAVPAYVPTIIMGTATIACIFGANILNKRAQAGLVSAYALLDQSYKEYKNKVKELHGEDGEQTIRESIVKDRYETSEIVEDELPLFFDEFSNRYFNASNETVLRAEYEINKMLSVHGGASLNEYYDLVGLPKVDYGEYLGWSAAQMFEMYWDGWLHFNHTKVEMDDGMECWIIDHTEPFADYLEY